MSELEESAADDRINGVHTLLLCCGSHSSTGSGTLVRFTPCWGGGGGGGGGGARGRDYMDGRKRVAEKCHHLGQDYTMPGLVVLRRRGRAKEIQ
jgi:hypothetical protein